MRFIYLFIIIFLFCKIQCLTLWFCPRYRQKMDFPTLLASSKNLRSSSLVIVFFSTNLKKLYFANKSPEIMLLRSISDNFIFRPIFNNFVFRSISDDSVFAVNLVIMFVGFSFFLNLYFSGVSVFSAKL